MYVNSQQAKTGRINLFHLMTFRDFFKYNRKMLRGKLTKHTKVICLPRNFIAVFCQLEFWIKHYSRVVYKNVYFIHFLRLWIINPKVNKQAFTTIKESWLKYSRLQHL